MNAQESDYSEELLRERRYRTTEISGKRAKATYICRTMQSNWHGAGYKQ